MIDDETFLETIPMKNGSGNRNSLNSLKRKNQHDVLQTLRLSGPLTIAEIADRTELSKVTVTKSIDHYQKKGLVVANGKGESTEDGGKRPNIYAFNPGYRAIFCVKIDENHLLAALTNLEGKIIASHTAFYDQSTSLENILKCVKDAYYLLMKRQDIAPDHCVGAVVGCHGVIDPEKGICFTSPHFSAWGTDIPLRDMVENLLPPGMPGYVDNWIHYHAYGEIKSMGSRVDRFFMIGTEMEGLAGGLVIDGNMYRGSGSLSGEIGHIIVDTAENAEVCACGGTGCFEAVVSPLRMVKRARENAVAHPDSPLAAATDELRFDDIIEAADAGDEFARTLLDRSARHFAVAINNIMQVCDPELVIIQGAYATAGEYFIARLTDHIQKVSLLAMKKNIRIDYSTLGDEGTILGAGSYVADLFFADPL
ncbi:MAG: ROK family transcriptional regulator [Planctomycetes bacterium]|nr:ROK family transcriptional regulator [Planctomycetota bacterium]